MAVTPVAQTRKEKIRYWRRRIASWRKSGMTQAGYCKKHGLKWHRFHYWHRKLEQSGPPGPLVQVPLRLSQITQPPSRPLVVEVKGRYRIEVPRGFDPVTLSQLVRTLGEM